MSHHTKPRRPGLVGRGRPAVLAVLLAVCIVPRAQATWSIVLVDTDTKEVAVGSATCLAGFDLEQWLPVVLVDTGGGVAQSYVDTSGANRHRIWLGLQNSMSPQGILNILEQTDNGHQTRQYGIADQFGRAITFTGTGAGAYADGVIGTQGTLIYAIQGNVLTGAPVIELAEAAVLGEPGDLAAKLMAGMEAARSMGGDGRCSCSNSNPMGCGSPPPVFEKSAHVGFMILARTGDADGVCTQPLGCANGDYFLNFNIAFQSTGDPDPVLQLAEAYNAWRAELVGRPDAVQSTVTVSPQTIPSDGTGQATMTIQLNDWQTSAIDPSTVTLTVEHFEGSDQTTTIGPVVDLGGGAYEIQLSGTTTVGIDRYRVVADDGVRPVVLIPVPTVISVSPSDFDADGYVDLADYNLFHSCITGPDISPGDPACVVADMNTDGDVDLHDFSFVQRSFTDLPCSYLEITEQPEPINLPCGSELNLTVGVEADPSARFQWFFEDKPIPGATQALYHVDSVDESNYGYHHVRVSNSCQAINSTTTLVRVYPFPCKEP